MNLAMLLYHRASGNFLKRQQLGMSDNKNPNASEGDGGNTFTLSEEGDIYCIQLCWRITPELGKGTLWAS